MNIQKYQIWVLNLFSYSQSTQWNNLHINRQLEKSGLIKNNFHHIKFLQPIVQYVHLSFRLFYRHKGHLPDFIVKYSSYTILTFLKNMTTKKKKLFWWKQSKIEIVPEDIFLLKPTEYIKGS